MGTDRLEHLPYSGESSQDARAFSKYLEDAKRGKTALQLKAVSDQLTPDLRRSWSARSFTAVSTPVGEFDGLVCNVSYHFYEHGQKYGNIRLYTRAANEYFAKNKQGAAPDGKGLLKLPQGTFERDGRIVSFWA